MTVTRLKLDAASVAKMKTVTQKRAVFVGLGSIVAMVVALSWSTFRSEPEAIPQLAQSSEQPAPSFPTQRAETVEPTSIRGEREIYLKDAEPVGQPDTPPVLREAVRHRALYQDAMEVEAEIESAKQQGRWREPSPPAVATTEGTAEGDLSFVEKVAPSAQEDGAESYQDWYPAQADDAAIGLAPSAARPQPLPRRYFEPHEDLED